ncbi:thioredoxin family protein [Clostridium peptidivorans]|uniref:thioredoxin family protein n=1 Tax=Clostridium peptidivorans TaxID=100174 RepID=UPI000BE461E4|nr:thioredoxin family protein [Clostridium peptidivorans]
MENINNLNELHTFINNNTFAFLYVSSKTCSVCTPLSYKVEEMLSGFPNISLKKMDLDELPEVGSTLSLFTVPMLILFVEGRETFRESRFVKINEFKENIKRIYEIYYS